MNQTLKTALIVGGTAVATTVAIDLMTGGAVRALISDKMSAMQEHGAAAADAAADAASSMAEAVSNGAAAVVDAVAG